MTNHRLPGIIEFRTFSEQTPLLVNTNLLEETTGQASRTYSSSSIPVETRVQRKNKMNNTTATIQSGVLGL